MQQPTLETTQPIEPIPLSPVERILWQLEEAVTGAFRVTILIRLEGCMEESLVGAALRNLQHRHPKLRASIVKGGDERPRYHFDQVPPIPFEIIDCEEGESIWREEVRRLMQKPFPTTGPLAAVTVIRSRSNGCCELLLAVHHAIADGLSAIVLVDDLLTEYARAEAEPNAPPRPALPAVVATRAKGPTGWARFKCTLPFDLREALEASTGPVTGRDLGCFVSMMNEYYEMSQRPVFWDLARRAHRNYWTFVQQGGPSFGYNMAAATTLLDKVGAIRRPFGRAARRPTPPSTQRPTLLATSYGVVNMRDAYGSLRPQACTITLKNDTIGPSIVIEGLILAGRLNVGLAVANLEPAFWENFQRAVRRHLDFAQSGRAPLATTQPPPDPGDRADFPVHARGRHA